MYAKPTDFGLDGGRGGNPTSITQLQGVESVLLQNRPISRERSPAYVHSGDRFTIHNDGDGDGDGDFNTALTTPRGSSGRPGNLNCGGSPQRTEPPPFSVFKQFLSSMSKAPLFLRSSPAQGTGSYGALPVIRDLNLNSDVDSSDLEEYGVNDVRRCNQRRRPISRPRTNGRSGLGVSETQNTRRSSRSRYEYETCHSNRR
jgi:hypothetical protein